MKKNVMMRAASALLIAVLLTTCAISGTFAKYTTSTTGTASARVAYWGFKQDASLTLDLFANTYNNSVTGEDSANVIAPGTENETEFSFAFSENAASAIAAPEVKYTIKVEATANTDVTDYQALDENPNFKWTLKAADASSATEYNTVAELLAAIEALSGATNGEYTYAAGSLPTKLNGTCKIGWKWAYETADDTNTSDKNEMATQDATDTNMGNAENLANVEITIKVTATQVD